MCRKALAGVKGGHGEGRGQLEGRAVEGAWHVLLFMSQ